ncbi:MAG: SpoVG family protein [Planctomycetota bacterium]|nr:SpoVG family protein [Planctomycetota bacterium]
MKVTEVRIKLNQTAGRLKAYCSVTFDDVFVIRELKLIDGPNGYFLAMPSKKLEDRCPHCSAKNQVRSHYCNWCGKRLPENRASSDMQGRLRLYADVAHPIKMEFRQMLHDVVMAAYRREKELAETMGENYQPKELWRIEELSNYIRLEEIGKPSDEYLLDEDEKENDSL